MNKTTQNPIHLLFQNLIWPAVAGNIAWAFFTLLIEKHKSFFDENYLPRFLVLLFLAIYLIFDWMTSEKEMERLKTYYWIGDAFHSIPIIILGISTYLNDDHYMFWSALFVLLVPMIGHLFGCWEPKEENSIGKRFKLAGISLFGIVTFLITYFCINTDWSYFVSILAVLIFWFKYRNKIYPPA